MSRPCEKELEDVDDLTGGDVERELAEDDGEQEQLQTSDPKELRSNPEPNKAFSTEGDVPVVGILRARKKKEEVSLTIMGLSDTSERSKNEPGMTIPPSLDGPSSCSV